MAKHSFAWCMPNACSVADQQREAREIVAEAVYRLRDRIRFIDLLEWLSTYLALPDHARIRDLAQQLGLEVPAGFEPTSNRRPRGVERPLLLITSYPV
jgi:hypothetical protein